MSSGGFFKRNWHIFVAGFVGSMIGQIFLVPMWENREMKSKPVETLVQEQVQYQPINASEFDSQFRSGRRVVVTSRAGDVHMDSYLSRLRFKLYTDTDEVPAYIPDKCWGVKAFEDILKDAESQVKVSGHMDSCVSGYDRLEGAVGKFNCLRAEHVQIGPTVYDFEGCGE